MFHNMHMLNFLVILDPCENPKFLGGLKFAFSIFNIIFIAIPIVLIVMLSIDLIKCVMSVDEEQKKNASLIIKRIIYSVLAFFVPTIVNLMLNLISDYITDINSDYNNCIANMGNIDYFEKRADELEEEEKKERNAELAELRATRERNLAKKSARLSTYHQSSSDNQEGSFVGQTYNMTDSMLRLIADKCANEQSSIEGVKAEASLMANRFELFGGSYGKGATGLYKYVYNSGWWASGTTHATDEQMAAVKEVLVSGKRTLPLYVDEHDCIDCGKYGYDIIKIVTGGKTITDKSELKKHSNYKKDDTIIYNKYTSIYTFYTFPSEYSDPFGYTENAHDLYEKLKGV